MILRTAHAKINLALHVTGQRLDGYHLLDTVVTFAEFGDIVTVEANTNSTKKIELSITGPFAKGLSTSDDNLVIQAAILLADGLENAGLKPEPVSITLEKNLPIASGMGGGSADASATLLALRQLWKGVDKLDLEEIAEKLGADVTMCLHSKPLRAEGIGDTISLLQTNEAFHLVLVNPGVEVSTPEVFKALENKNNPPIRETELSHFPDKRTLTKLRNDLQLPATLIAPTIANALQELEKNGCRFARMTGSGATCFGLFKTQEEAEIAANIIKIRNRNWWCVATSTKLS